MDRRPDLNMTTSIKEVGELKTQACIPFVSGNSTDLHFSVLKESLQDYLLMKPCPPAVVFTANAPM